MVDEHLGQVWWCAARSVCALVLLQAGVLVGEDVEAFWSMSFPTRWAFRQQSVLPWASCRDSLVNYSTQQRRARFRSRSIPP